MPAAQQTNEAFGRYLRECREASGIGSQRAVKRKLEEREVFIDASRITNYENGRIGDPTPGVLYHLAKLYGVDPLAMLMELCKDKFAIGGERIPFEGDRWEAAIAAASPPKPLGPDGEGGLLLEEHQLRARRDFLADAQVFDVEGLAAWQRELGDLRTFWVIAPDFLDDENHLIAEAVVHNIHRGVEYTYFITAGSEARFKQFVASEVAPSCNNCAEDVKPPMPGYVLLPGDTATWLHADYAVANPERRQKAIGFQSLRAGSQTRFSLRMERDALHELLDHLRQWQLTKGQDAANKTPRPRAKKATKKKGKSAQRRPNKTEK